MLLRYMADEGLITSDLAECGCKMHAKTGVAITDKFVPPVPLTLATDQLLAMPWGTRVDSTRRPASDADMQPTDRDV